MGVFRATWLAPHLLGFASRVWNLFSSNISSQCLICCPIKASLQTGIFQQLHKKDQFCLLEDLFMLISRFTVTITNQVWHSYFTEAFLLYFADTFSHTSILLFQSTQNNLFNSLCWTAEHILHIWIWIHCTKCSKTLKSVLFIWSCTNTPSKSFVWEVESFKI